MKKQEAVNTFSEGLILDLNPLSMPNDALTNCLNGTLLTFNDNENMLQNDMGNARVETAMLPTGYIPLGSTSFGGIIYIVSYNPIEKKYQIGSFPSPERNLSKEELGDESNCVIDLNNFCADNNWKGFDNQENIITNYFQKINLLKTPIYPGDKYKVFSDNLSDFKSHVSAYDEGNIDKYKTELYPKYIKFDIVSTDNTGKITSLTDNSVWTIPENLKNISGIYPYYIYLGDLKNSDDETINLEEYRGLVGSNYDTYVSRESGKLGIAARLEVPTSFSVGYEILTTEMGAFKDNELGPTLGTVSKQSIQRTIQFYFNFNWTNDNIGEHKNRVNPYGVRYYLNDSRSNDLEINLKSDIGKEQPSDTKNNCNYYTLEVPEYDGITYYQDEFSISRYLEENNKINYKFGEEYRKNDGTDFQYTVKGPKIIQYKQGKKLHYSFDLKDNKPVDPIIGNILNIDFIPYMPFGQLEFLRQTLSLNLDKVNSGEMELSNYQYYVDNEKINLNFNFEAYPETGKRITDFDLELYPLSENINNSNSRWLKQDTYDNEETETGDSIKLNGTPIKQQLLPPFNGLIHTTIDKSELEENKIYIVKFNINYSGTSRIFYRLLFNNTLFNNAYGTGQDFKDLYLYDASENYGINPTLKLDNNGTSTVDDSLVYNFDKYKTEITEENTTRTYPITQKIESNFIISTGLEDEVILKTSSVNVDTNKVTITNTNNESIQLSDFELNSNFTSSGENYSINIVNKFNAIIPYTIDYSNVVSYKIYELTPLKDGTNNCRVMLQHDSKEENEGFFRMFVNYTNKTNTQDEVRYEQECADQTTDLLFNTSAIESILKEIINTHNDDYLTVLFGIGHMGDNNCGYGYKEFGGQGYEYFYRCGSRPVNMFAKINCLRKDDSVVLVHPRNTNLKTASTIGAGKSDTVSYLNFDSLVNSANDATIIKSIRDNSTKEYISQFKKYTPTGSSKILYYINGIGDNNVTNNPRIDIEYTIPLKISDPKIYINTIGITDDDNCVTNLRIKTLDTFNTNYKLTSVINNSTFINKQYQIDYDQVGWDIEKDNTISQSQLSSVYSENNIVKSLKLNSNSLVELSENAIDDCVATQWYFGWEDLKKGSKQRQITYGQFKDGTKQWYKLYCTYTLPSSGELESILEERQLYYELDCIVTSFVQNCPYKFYIKRLGTPSDFTGGVISISYDNCTSDTLSFTDSGNQEMEDDGIEIIVTPTSANGSIKLIYNEEVVGEYDIKDAIDINQTIQ